MIILHRSAAMKYVILIRPYLHMFNKKCASVNIKGSDKFVSSNVHAMQLLSFTKKFCFLLTGNIYDGH